MQEVYYMLWAVDRPAPGSAPAAVGGRHGLGGPDIRAVVSDPRMLSLPDPAYWAEINSVRSAAGLAPITSPPPANGH